MKIPEFTSEQTLRERVAVLIYLPIHIWVLPLLMSALCAKGTMSEAEANFLYYSAGLCYVILTQFGFLRREFDPLCDRPLNCLVEIVICYGLMIACNLVMNLVMGLMTTDNPNNQAIVGLAEVNGGTMYAIAVFMAPILEELLFRAGIFGTVRKYSRPLAYISSILMFSVYHVWAYAAVDPRNWIYIIQYFPVSYLLCRCYERTNTIWGSMFFHGIVNFISLKALDFLAQYQGML